MRSKTTLFERKDNEGEYYERQFEKVRTHSSSQSNRKEIELSSAMYPVVQCTVWAYISLGVNNYNLPSIKDPKVHGCGVLSVESKEGNLRHS